jgi:RNA polymerase sigma-70 factor, ECF subfamily
MSLEEQTDVQRMLRVRRGDTCAFRELHESHQRPLILFFYGMTHNTSLANDLAQETFLRVWKIRKRYQATGSFSAYLFGIARMILLESQRQARKVWGLGQRMEPGAELRLAGPSGARPDARALRGELQEQIFAALEMLPDNQRIVFVLRNIEGLSLQDIASTLDCPLNTVRSRRILAVKKLRTLLADVYKSHSTPTPKEY